METGIRKATLTGLKWGAALQIGQNAMSVLVSLVLVRLLDQADFGLVALVTSILSLMATVVDLGFGAALVQKRDLTDADVSTAFLSNLGLGVSLTVFVALAAPWLAAFWNEPALSLVLVVSSALLTIRAFASVPTALCERDLDLKSLTNLTITSVLLGSAVKIAMAWTGFGVWSLVIGEIVTQSILSTRLCLRFRRRFSLASVSKSRFGELFRYGRSIALTNLLNNLSSNIDVLVVGKLLSSSLLGIYTVALTLATLLSKLFTAVMQRIAFPAFSRVQDDPARLQKGYLEALRYSSMLVVPPTIGLALVADEFVRVVLTDKWEQSIPIIRLLALYATTNALGGPLWGQVLKAKGRVELLLGMSVVRVIALPAAILAGSHWGLIGICAGIVIYALIFRLLYQHIINRYLGIVMRDFFGAVAPSLVGAAFMSACVVMAGAAIAALGSGPLILLVSKVVIGAAAYVAALLMFQREPALALWSTIVEGSRPAGGSRRERIRNNEA